MSRRRRPALTPEDRALWRAATRDTVPLPAEARGTPAPPDQPTPPGEARDAPEPGAPQAPGGLPAGQGAAPGSSAPPGSRPPRPRGGGDPAPSGRGPAASPPAPPPRVTLDPAPPAATRPGPSAPGLDRRTAERLGRGARAPEARIDLHGMTAERAHRALERCIAAALARGQRLVLVITGKGGRAGTGGAADAAWMRPAEGVLRREAPRWLRAGPHAGEIVGIFEAHPRHGGAGAFYVYLKKRR